MKEKNACYTYFRIVGDFDPDEITRKLGLSPFEIRRIGDALAGGRRSEFAAWNFGKCDDYDLCTDEQMWRTIEPLLGKEDILNEIRERYDVVFWLEIVPELYVSETTPSLAPSLEVMDFCHATRTRLDIDLYIYGKKADRKGKLSEGK